MNKILNLPGIKYREDFKKDAEKLVNMAVELAKKEGLSKNGQYVYDNKNKVGAGITNSGLIYFDIELDRKLRIMKQNPAKSSRWAKLAREGHSVYQVMYRDAIGYLGVIIDGNFYMYVNK